MSQKKSEKGRATNSILNEDEELFKRRREKLLGDISTLRLILSKAEAQVATGRFADVVLDEKFFPGERRRLLRPPDPRIALKFELQALSGVHARKLDDGFAFCFGTRERRAPIGSSLSTPSRGGDNDSYWIHFSTETGEEWRPKRWVLPMSVNVATLLEEYPVDSPLSIKYFIRECKRRVDCYRRRRQQYREFQAYISELNLYNSSVEADLGFTRVIWKLAIASSTNGSPTAANSSLRTKAVRTMFIDLRYKSNETRPTRMIIESDNENVRLADEEIKRMRVLLKGLKEQDLRDAAIRIFTSAENDKVWLREPHHHLERKDPDEQEDNDEVAMDESSARLTNKTTVSRAKRKQRNDSDQDSEHYRSEEDDISPSRVTQTQTNSKKGKKAAVAKKRKIATNAVMTEKENKKGQNIRKPQNEEETSESRGKVKNTKSGKKSTKPEQPKLSRYFSPDVRIPGTAGKNRLPCSTPIVGRHVRLELEEHDDISAIVQLDNNSDNADRDTSRIQEARESTTQAELLRDVRAVHFAMDQPAKPAKKAKAAVGGRKKSAIKKKR